MNDYNLKLLLKSELSLKMPSNLFRELIEESNIKNKLLRKAALIASLFEEYSLDEIKDMILSKYNDGGFLKHHNRLFEKIEGPSLDEKRAMKIKEEKKKRIERLSRPRIGINKLLYQTSPNYDTTQLYKCPKCGDLLYLKDREDGSGEFYQCEKCKEIYNHETVQSFAKYHAPRSILNKCPRCGSNIIPKVGGPRGNFFGCEEYPTCDFAYSELLRLKYTPKLYVKNEKEIEIF